MKDRSAAMRRCRANLEAIKRPKEVSLGEHTSLGPKATAPITVICLSPDLTLGVSSRTYSGMDTRYRSIKLPLRCSRGFVNSHREPQIAAKQPQRDSQCSVSSPAAICRQICEPMTSRHGSVAAAGAPSVNAKFCV